MNHFTEKMLMDWAGQKKYQEGRAVFERDTVLDYECVLPYVRGTLVSGSRSIRTGFRILPDGSVESLCPCYDNRERGIVCSHVVALALELRRRMNDPERIAQREAELRRAERLARVDERQFLRRGRPGSPDAVPASIQVRLPADWHDRWRARKIPVDCRVLLDGRALRPSEVPSGAALELDEADESVLFVLEDIAGGSLPTPLELNAADFANLLRLHEGRALAVGDAAHPLSVRAHRVSSRLRIDLDPESGELVLSVRTVLPEAGGADATVHIVHRKDGWAGRNGALWRIDRLLPDPFHGIYDRQIRVPRMSVPRFLRTEWPNLGQIMPVDSELSAEMFSVEPARPRFRLMVRGSAASLAAVLYAEYDGTSLIAGKADPAGHFAIPDPADLLRYLVRNNTAEQEALQRLAGLGFQGDQGDRLQPMIGERAVLNFLARQLPALRRRGWKVELQGRAAAFMDETPYVTPVARLTPVGGGQWFDVELRFEDARGVSLDPAEIRRAMLKGESYVETPSGLVIFDGGAVEAMQEVFSDCASTDGDRAGTFRLSKIYASYVAESLNALDGIDIEANGSWRQAAARLGSATDTPPPELPEPLASSLRPYQREGVRWLRHLEHCGFAGILADEMGLGKTIQALAWLQLERLMPEARGQPALIVCPTSLVENWAEEAARFTPGLRVRLISGLERHAHWDEVGKADLLVTSYALMRRDVDRYRDLRFSVVVLDEAQHIKNRSTRNAIASKRLQAHHRLVLTGTPMENSVADLWSIMDFLMPGYLGEAERFRKRYELPIAQGGETGDAAQTRLRRKLQPFLLRRLKREVARELPPKIERIAWCSLSGDQQRVYAEVLESSRRRIANMVAERGFEASRMEILRTLLRLRQTCCHLDLLRLEGLNSEFPSAKMDLMFELLDEAVDGGHRVLVFSQFVSMLTILRREIERRQWRYCYLDGATTDRMGVVRQFNGDREIPIFLISLKAGGTGLNLTGADMVVHYDPWWNPAVEDQATDRAYRIGQRRTVYGVKLITRDTVEERVLAMQRRKQQIIDATVQPGGTPLHRMNWEDVKELLDL